MKRICLFAGYDKDGVIDDYVLFYVKKLSEISDVYYYGDFDCQKEELAKLEKYCVLVQARRHKKYDFGSWQELINIIGKEKIRKYDSLILANDSCFGPLFPIQDVFNKMEKEKCDFWGLSSSRWYHIHIQSYFVVINNSVLQNDVLFDFFNSVVPQISLSEVCKNYEDRLSYILCKEGFTFKTLIPYREFDNHPYFNVENSLKKAQMPLLKVKTFYGEVGKKPIKDWEKMISNYSNYDTSLIQNNLTRRGLSEEDIKSNINFSKNKFNIKRILFNIIKFLLFPIRQLLHKFVDNKISYVIDYFNSNIFELRKEMEKLKQSNKLNDNSKINSESDYIVTDEGKTETLLFIKEDTFVFKELNNLFNNIDENGIDILFLGNFSLRNCLNFKVKNNKLLIINNSNINYSLLKLNTFKVKNLKKYQIYKNNKPIKLDMVFIEPFLLELNEEDITGILNNIVNKTIFESRIIISVAVNKIKDYEKIFEKIGLIHDMDSEELYNNKICSTKGYKILFLKKK